MCLYIRDRLLRLITDGSTLHAPLLSVLYLEATHRPFTPTLLSSFFSLLFPFAHPTPSRLFFFFFNDPPPPEISPLPLPDALPICPSSEPCPPRCARRTASPAPVRAPSQSPVRRLSSARRTSRRGSSPRASMARAWVIASRSEEHTSELQSRLHLVCRLLLEKKNKE